MDFGRCKDCGQPVVQWPFEEGWNHYSVSEKEPIDWSECDRRGCFCNAQPYKEKMHERACK